MLQQYLGEDLSQLLAVAMFLILLLIMFPQMYRERNSFWFAPIKFWFYMFPIILCVMGLIVAAPIFAILGLFMQEYQLVTILYLYALITTYIVEAINDRYDNILTKI